MNYKFKTKPYKHQLDAIENQKVERQGQKVEKKLRPEIQKSKS